jgi:DNA repair exonuclease SbcCD ATPase subunit
VAALGILELEEKKTEGFSERVYADKSIREIIPMVSDIKKRTEVIQERRGKTREELDNLRAQQLEAQAKAKADAKQAEAEHNALLKKEADARREENNRKADALAKQIKENDKRAKDKEVLNQLAMAGLEEKLAQKKAWEAAQRIQDAYLPIRRDVESMMGKFETLVSERNPLREDVKALAKLKALRTEDRKRLCTAATAVGDWYCSWVAEQFAPLPTAKKELAEMVKKEKSKRQKEIK